VTRAPAAGRPRVVELAGPAGAGKSTLMAALRERHPDARVDPEIRELAGRPTVAVTAAAAALTLGVRVAFARGAVRDQLEMMTHLELLRRELERDDGAGVLLLDQGPVFYLTRPVFASSRLDGWRSRMLDRWAQDLSLVVWLDAADETLAGRIDGRDKDHALKGADRERTRSALDDARATLDDALRRLSSRPSGPEILRFDTGTTGIDDVAAGVTDALERCAR